MIFTNKNTKVFSKIRLDKFLVLHLKNISRALIKKMILDGDILVNHEFSKASYLLKIHDEVYVKKILDTEPLKLKKQNIFIQVLYENNDFLVINKPSGLVVHSSESVYERRTLVNALLNKIHGGSDNFRPGIVHRLDKDTSGALIVTKNQKTYEYFVEMFKNHKIKKIYLVLVKGKLNHKQGIIDSPIGRSIFDRKKMNVVDENSGRSAITRFKVIKELEIKSDNVLSLLEVEIETGRTHQIRVHMAAIGHPVIGDGVYGIRSFNKKIREKFGLNRQFLHACKLEFEDLDKKKISIEARLPDDLEDFLKKI